MKNVKNTGILFRSHLFLFATFLLLGIFLFSQLPALSQETTIFGARITGKQRPGQWDGQINAIIKTQANSSSDSRTFSGKNLLAVNFPLSGMGTGQIYFDGKARITHLNLGKVGNEALMTFNSLFAINVNNNGNKTTKVLQGANVINAFIDQPCNTTRNTGLGKHGNYCISTGDVAPHTGDLDNARTGILESNAFTLPSACTQVTALIGGGRNAVLEYLALVDASNGEELVKVTGNNSNKMENKIMNVSAYQGKSVFFRIADIDIGYTGSYAKAGWGHIDVDYIQLKDSNGTEVPSSFANGDFETGDLTGWEVVKSSGTNFYDNITVKFEYPFAWYTFTDAAIPVITKLEIVNPMVPMNEKFSVIPTGIFKVTLTNTASNKVSVNVLSTIANGLSGTSRTNTEMSDASGKYVTMTSTGYAAGTYEEGSLCLQTGEPGATFCAGAETANSLLNQLNTSGALNNVTSGDGSKPVAGVCAPVELAAGETKTVTFTWSWYFPHLLGSNIWGKDETDVSRRYCNYFSSVTDVMKTVVGNLNTIYTQTKQYHDAMFDTNLPWYLTEAVASNCDVMRSSTMFIMKNGEVYGWEGSNIGALTGKGCCTGNCTHVWGPTQAMPNLYPELERRWRTLNFTRQQTASGILNNRIGSIPAPMTPSGEGVAIDGTLENIIDAYREYRNSPDQSWFDTYWPNIKKAMDGSIATWDPNHDGTNEFSANTTYDGFIGGQTIRVEGLYLVALRAAEEMAKIKEDTASANFYHRLFIQGRTRLNNDTYNGEYFYQVDSYPLTARPADQFGPGVVNDHMIGQSFSFLNGLGLLAPQERLAQSSNSVFKYNFFSPVDTNYYSEYDRIFAHADDDATIGCTWPNGGKGTATYLGEDQFGYAYESVIANIFLGNIDKAMTTLHGMRSRLDGNDMDPLNELECGDYYARGMVSFGILEAATGIQKNIPKKMLGFKPNMQPDNIKAFFAAGTGWGSFQQTQNISHSLTTQIDRISVKYGTILLRTLQFYFPESLTKTLKRVSSIVRINGKKVPVIQTISGNQVKLTFAKDMLIDSGTSIESTIKVNASTDINFSDDFSGGSLKGWKKLNGIWVNNDVKAEALSEDGDIFMLRTLETGSSFTFEADIRPLTNNSAGFLIFRSNQDTDQAYAVSVNTNNTIQFLKYPYSLIASYNTPVVVGTTYHIKVEIKDHNFRVYLNNSTEPVINANDKSYLWGKIGLGVSNGNVEWDNVSVKGNLPASGKQY